MLPFLIDEGELPFARLDYLFIPGIREAVMNKVTEVLAYVVKDGTMKPFTLRLGEMTDEERQIILDGCLINYNRVK
jgi:aconitate hydratase